MTMSKGLMLFLSLTSLLLANEAEVQDVSVSKTNGGYTFAVKILHEDSGWKHYVDAYEILDKDGNILGKRVLWHPHENEQPFTRSLTNVKINNIQTVYVRAHDSVDGYSALYEVTLP